MTTLASGLQACASLDSRRGVRVCVLLAVWRECEYRTLIFEGTCGCGNETSVSIKCGEFLDELKICSLLKKDSAP